MLLAAGKVRPRLVPVSNTHHALVLGEAFLLWIALFLGLNIGAAVLETAFQNDRKRQNWLALRGWQVLRFTWLDITQNPDRVLAEIRAAISAR